MQPTTSIAAVIPDLSVSVSPTGPTHPAPAVPSPASPNSFESVLRQLSNEAVSDVKTGEATAFAGLQGKASVREVVDAVMRAERSLQTVIAVRDKVISAYQEISRMQI